MSALKDSIDFFLECVSQMPSGSGEGEEDASLWVEEVTELQASMVVLYISQLCLMVFSEELQKRA